MITTTKQQQKCAPGKFKRMNYFNGMLLTEQDFRDEQLYLREKLKLHNRFHGPGVIWNLCLKKGCIEVEVDNQSTKITKIFIGAGLALDCAGNEIVVCEDYLVPLDQKIEEMRKLGQLIRNNQCNTPQYEGPKLYIGIKYCECESQPAEQYTSECESDPLRPQFSRVREGFSVVILTENEYRECIDTSWNINGKSTGCDCPGLPPCSENEMIIFLGCIENYDANDPNFPNHNDAIITHIDNKLSTVAELQELVRPNTDWGRYKLLMLKEIFKNEDDWIDVSILVGQGAADIEHRLAEMKLKLGEIYQPPLNGDTGDFEAVLEKAKCALPWAKRDLNDIQNSATIDIVTDREGKCILFAFVNNPQPSP